jgi:PAS domain S-box-containing protein
VESDLRRALDEISRLQGCLNDLISVQALPAIWSGLGTAEIVNTLLDALIRMLHLDFACARVNASVDGPRFEAARLPSTPGQDGRLHHRRALEAWLQGDLPTGPVLTSNPIGPGDVRIAPWRLGLQEEVGVVVTASERPDFPTELEMVVLRVAANQAAVGLQEGRFLKWADERLRRSEAQLVQGQSLAHSGSWGWNVSSGELIFSDETFRILGFDPEQPVPSFGAAIGRIHPDDRATVLRVLATAVRDQRDYQFEARLALPDGSAKYVDVAGRPFTNGSGGLEFVGTVLDITDRRRGEEKLVEVQAQLAHMARVTIMGELSASIAHEVNQPLGAIATDGYACLRWLNRTEPNVEEAKAAVTRMIHEATRASEVTVRIRSLARKPPHQTIVIDMNEAILGVLSLTRHTIRKNGILLKTDLAADLRLARGDLVQLQQVMVNLIVNAVEAMAMRDEGPREFLVTSQNQGQDQIVIQVHDTGIGLDPGCLQQIFQPFVTSKPDGMGIGLSLSRTIVEAHGGRLWAERNRGPGATFRFSLLAAEA